MVSSGMHHAMSMHHAMDSMRQRLGRSGSGPVRLDRLAEACLAPAVMRQGFGSARMIAAWDAIVGPDLAGRTRPERIRWPGRREEPGDIAAATLVIRAEGFDALELQHMAAIILDRVNAMFGWRAVGRIAIRQAPVELGPAEPLPPPEAPAIDSPALQAVQDPDLRAALARLGACIARREDTAM